MPAGSKTGPPLAKAKPISASVITYLRRRKTLRERELLQPERGVRRCKKLCRHPGFGSGRGYRGGFCEKLLEASPVSDGANASRLQDGSAPGQGQANQRLCDNIFKKENKRVKRSFCNQREEREDVRNSADTKVSEEGGGGGAPDTRAKIPLQPMVKTMVRQAVPCSPWRKDEGV
ncbi:hypothetical protein GRJ2_000402100 [Grus japonensis]|uniref:Uncharacterized protein n=1 Tax=Grus japonensis TaxID=30415 RepID=A0ABC9W2G5_GRUJA